MSWDPIRNTLFIIVETKNLFYSLVWVVLFSIL